MIRFHFLINQVVPFAMINSIVNTGYSGMQKLSALFFLLFWAVLGMAANEPLVNTGKKAEVSEQIYVQTDRDIYIAGETVYFKMNLYASETGKASLSKVGYLVLRDKRNAYQKLNIRLEKDAANGSFYLPDTLKTGMYEIVAYTNYMRNFEEKFFFRKNLIIVNRFDEWLNNLFQNTNSVNFQADTATYELRSTANCPVQIFADRDSVPIREKVKLTIKPTHNANPGRLGPFCVTVKAVNPFTLYLTQQTNNKLPEEGSSEESASFAGERDGIYLSGTITDKSSNPVGHECLILSIPDSVPNLQYTYSDDKGRFRFHITDYYLGKQLFITPRSNLQDKYQIQVDDKFSLKEPYVPLQFGLTRDLRKYILESQSLVRIQKAYSTNYTKEIPYSSSGYILPYVFREASSVVRPADYVALKNFQDIAENILPGVKLKNEGGRNVIYVINYLTKQFFQSPAALFVDGVPVFDLNQIMNLGSADISRIEICKVPRVKGDLAFSGILSVITARKDNLLSSTAAGFTFNMGKYAGTAYYNAPNYGTDASADPTPDFRQLLYWNPNLECNMEGKDIYFTASDWQGIYLAELSGIDENGTIFKTYAILKVYQ